MVAKTETKKQDKEEAKTEAKKKMPGVLKVEIKFVEDVLGTTPGNKDIALDYTVGKELDKSPRSEAEMQEEMDALPNVEEEVQKASTFFPRNKEGKPILWNFQVKGLLKEACNAMLLITKDPNLTNYKKKINLLFFPFPRQIILNLPEGSDGKLGWLERPMRAPTPQGERSFLLRSEVIPAGTTAKFGISVLNPDLLEYVKTWLTYGALHGFLQWRNGGYGSFIWRELPQDADVGQLVTWDVSDKNWCGTKTI